MAIKFSFDPLFLVILSPSAIQFVNHK
uniref:Uncharacterized protein n=1 Tax=Rhizophora mucronata TaxID=61149 RepID=A0A2P2PHN8_RHIMU